VDQGERQSECVAAARLSQLRKGLGLSFPAQSWGADAVSQDVMHFIAAADYPQFQKLITDLLRNHGRWLARHDASRAARERQTLGSFTVVQVWPEEFRRDLLPRGSSSELELRRFASRKHASFNP
jgi:hypothetical protein